MSRDAFVLKIQRELCHTKYARNVSGLSRNRPQVTFQLRHYEGTLYRNSFRADHRCQFPHQSSLNPCYSSVAMYQWEQMASNKRITSLAPKENVRQLPCISLCSGRVHECLNLAANCPKPVAGFDAGEAWKRSWCRRKSWQLSTVISYIKCNSTIGLSDGSMANVSVGWQ